MNQEQIWDKISPEWSLLKKVPIQEAKEFLKNKKGNILDLGCGSGRNFAKVNGTIHGVDFSQEQLKYARKKAKEKNIKVKLTQSEAHKLPFKDNFFDAVLFIATLHCIDSKQKRKQSLKELLRVMKPKSQAMITVWNKNQKRFKNSPKEKYIKWKDKGKRYYYLYEKQELLDLLKSVGFKIKKVYKKQNENKQANSQKNIIVIVEK